MNDLTIGGAIVPYQRSLEGAELAREFSLIMSRMEIGDTLFIPNKVFVRLGPEAVVTPPPYPHTRWRDEKEHGMMVRRDG